MPRKSEGRRKIEIVKITKESSSLVAFSKRRSGVFKKASELCTLCGAQIAVIVHSHTRKKVYSLGCPDVDEVVNRFLARNPDFAASQTTEFVQRLRNASVQDLYNQLTNLLGELDSEKKVGEQLQKMKDESQEHYWWDGPIEDMALADLGLLKMAITQLQEVAQKQVQRHMA